MANFKTKSVPVKPTKAGGVDLKALLEHAGGVDTIIKEKGISGKDARQLRNAAERVIKSNNTFLLKDKGFDVFDESGKPITSAGKGTGNKKGFNAGDLIGLGNANSKLAGVLGDYKKSYLKSQVPDVPKIEKPTTTNVTSAPKPVDTTPEKGPAPKKSTSSKVSARDLILQKQKESGLESKLNEFSDKYNKQGNFKPGGGSFKGKGGGSGSWEGDKKKADAPILTAHDILGEFANLDDPNYWAKLGAIWNPAQFWRADAREKARELARNEKTKPNELQGGFPDAGLLGALAVPGGVGIVKTAVQKGAKKATQVTAQKLLGESTKPAQKLLPAAKTPKQLPKGFGEPAPNPNVVYKGTSTKSKYIKEASKRMEEGFKKGGKLPEFGPGGKPIMDKMKTPGNLTQAQLMALAASGQFNGTNIADLLSGNTTPGEFQPQPLSGNKSGKAGDVGADLLKYAFPYVTGALRDRQLTKNTPTVKYSPQDLMVGTVQDLPKPNFKLRSREPIGTDVMTRQLGQKFGDTFQREKEADFNVQNALSKLQQKEQVIGRINQQRSQNNEGAFRSDVINAQIKSGVAQQKYGAGTSRDIGTFQNLMGQLSDNAFINADQAARAWELEIRDPNTTLERKNQLYLEGIPKGKKGMKFKTRYGRK